MNINRCFIAGHLCRDLELRYTPKGTAIGKSSVAINRKWKTESGEDKEEVTFVEFSAWGRTAEVIGQYLKKGDQIYFEGRLKLDTWDDKQSGQKRQKLYVVVESFQFVPKGNGTGAEQSAPSGSRSRPSPSAAAEAPQADAPEEDNVPF